MREPLPEIDTKGLNARRRTRTPNISGACTTWYIWRFKRTPPGSKNFMLESENSSQSELWNYATYVLGYKGATHDIAHKRPAEYSFGQWDWRAEQHAYFLQRLKDTPEADGNSLTVPSCSGARPPARISPTAPSNKRNPSTATSSASSTGTCTASRACRWPTCSSDAERRGRAGEILRRQHRP